MPVGARQGAAIKATAFKCHSSPSKQLGPSKSVAAPPVLLGGDAAVATPVLHHRTPEECSVSSVP